jgi:hypothetical protein
MGEALTAYIKSGEKVLTIWIDKFK